MKLLPLERLGAREISGGVIRFGLILPWVNPSNGQKLFVKVIHEKDQFIQDIQPMIFALEHSLDPEYMDYWSAEVRISAEDRRHSESRWGEQGRYVYRYFIENQNPGVGVEKTIDWIIDPFAREFGTGKLSAFTLGYRQYGWSEREGSWKTPRLDDLIVYELMISEFGGDIQRTIEHLDYLKDMGITCIEIMPVSNVANQVDWGFLPIGYFGVDERFGKRSDMQRLIDEAHRRGIAVLVDSVYGHTSEWFPYSYVYKKLGYAENPFIGHFAKDYYGESTDFRRDFTRNFFFTVNHHWLDCYHVDGFRYDCVPEWWDGPMGVGYANLTYETYQTVKSKKGEGYWNRFFSGDMINIIQCAEQLEAPREVVTETYSNCTWQHETLGAAENVAHGVRGELVKLGLQYGLMGYPDEVRYNGDRIKKSAFQYLESHDHSRFLCNFRTLFNGNELLAEGDRNLWYKVQPYLIGLLTARGIPMLWQGQEFAENYYVPDQGWGRVAVYRPVRWDYFYDNVGRSMVGLVRKLVRLRNSSRQFRSGDHYFYNDDNYLSRGLLLFSRKLDGNFSLVALNFGDTEQTVQFRFPFSGDYREELHGDDAKRAVVSGTEQWLNIPGNYGKVWTLETPA